MPRLCLHLSGAVIFSVTAGACYCHCLQPAPALWFPRTTPDTAPPTLLPTLTLIPSLPQQGVHTRWGLSDRAGVRLGSLRKGFTQLCLPRSLLLVTQSPSGQGRCYRPLVKVRFSTKAQLLKRKKRVWCSETVSSSPLKERWEES